LANVSKQLDIGRSMFPPQAAAMAEKRTGAGAWLCSSSRPVSGITPRKN